MMSKILQVLMLEDSPSEAELLILQLEQDGFEVEWQRVETEAEFFAGLDSHPDLILADYSLPSFNGIRALELRNQRGLDIPFILVSGTVGEDLAVEAMRNGAADYLLKDRPARLGEAVRRALEDRNLRRENQRTLEQLRESEKRFRALIENSNDVVGIFNRGGEVMFISTSLTRNFGYLPGQVLGSRLTEYIHPNDTAPFSSRWAELLQTPQAVYSLEFRVRHADGGWRWVEGSAQNLLAEPGVGGIVINARDVTERKQAEAKYRTLVEEIPAITYIAALDEVKTRLYLSPQVETILGHSPAESLADPNFWRRLVHPADRERVLAEAAHFYATDEPFDSEYRLRAADGRLVWVHDRAIIARDDRGEPLYIQGIQMDITQRKRAEEALWRSEEKYRTLVEQIPAVVYSWELGDPGRCHYISPRIETMLGFFVEEWLADPDLFFRQVHPDDRAGALAAESHSRATGEPLLSEFRMLTRDGRVIWVRDEALILPAKADQPRLNQGLLIDITERRQAEQELRLFRSLIDQSNDSIQVIDPQSGQFLDVNARGCAELGYSREEFLSLSIFDIDSTIERSIFPVSEGARKTMPLVLEGRHRRKDGSTFPVETSLKYVKLERGYLVGVTRDITERKQAEEGLRESEHRYRLATNATNDVIWEWDFQTDHLTWTENAQSVFGYALEEFDPYEAWWEDRLHPQDRERVLSKLNALIASNASIWTDEYRFACKDSAYLHLSDRAYIERDELGKPVRMIGAMSDITGRKRAEARIQRQVERLNSLHTIDLAISSSFDLRIILEIVLQQVHSQLGVDASAVVLTNLQGQMMEYVASQGFRSNIMRYTPLRIGEGSAGRVVLERKMIHISDETTIDAKLAGTLQASNESFLEYYGVPLIVKGEIKGVLELYHRSPLGAELEWIEFLETLAGQAAIAIDNSQLFDGLQRSNLELGLAYDATIEGWSRAMDLRDRETEGHSQRVTDLTLKMTRAMQLSESELIHIRRGALLHDMGKLGVPDYILLKPGKLTDEEWVIMKQHPQFAYNMLSEIHYLKPALEIPYCHHEKWDGSGYPRGLKGETIPLAARIFAVVDVWDALTSDRPYRSAWTQEQALAYIQEQSGKHFDPSVVETFLKLIAAK